MNAWELCFKHQTFRSPGAQCAQCAAEAAAAGYRDALAVLEARIADLEATQLRDARQISVLQQQLADLQRAQNVLAQASEREHRFREWLETVL